MKNITRLIICCLIFANSTVFCSLKKTAPALKLVKISRTSIEQTKANDHIKDLNSRLLTFIGNVFRRETNNSSQNFFIEELQHDLSKIQNTPNTATIVDSIFNEEVNKIKPNPKREQDLESVRAHTHKMIKERDDHAAN